MRKSSQDVLLMLHKFFWDNLVDFTGKFLGKKVFEYTYNSKLSLELSNKNQFKAIRIKKWIN